MKKIFNNRHLNILLLLFSFTFFVFTGCSGNLESDLKKLDKIYGYCDNPQRNIKGAEYTICKDKERAAGPKGISDKKEPLNISEIFEKFNNNFVGDSSNQSNINTPLWQASLSLTKNYDLKFVDSKGGYIQTEWIYLSKDPDARCLIKIQIKSNDLVSNGVQSTFLCEQRKNNIWEMDGIEYLKEEKNLNLKILELAQEYSNL